VQKVVIADGAANCRR